MAIPLNRNYFKVRYKEENSFSILTVVCFGAWKYCSPRALVSLCYHSNKYLLFWYILPPLNTENSFTFLVIVIISWHHSP